MLLIRDGLKRERSESELALGQFDQTIEHRCNIAKACRQVLFDPMKDLLEMIDDGDDTEHPLDDHAIIALARLPKLPVDRLFSAFAEAKVDFRLRSARSRPLRLHESVGRACWRWPTPSQ